MIVGGPKEVGEGTGLFGGKGASRHCDAAKHGTGIKMRKGPQIIDGADLGSTALGAIENPLPNLMAACVHLILQEVLGGEPPREPPASYAWWAFPLGRMRLDPCGDCITHAQIGGPRTPQPGGCPPLPLQFVPHFPPSVLPRCFNQ